MGTNARGKCRRLRTHHPSRRQQRRHPGHSDLRTGYRDSHHSNAHGPAFRHDRSSSHGRPGGTGTIYLSASVSADQEAFSPINLPTPQIASSTIQVLAVAGSAQASTPLALTVSLTNPAFAPTKVNLPIVRINNSGAPIVSKEVDVPGTITITSADGSTTYLPNSADTDNTAAFHVHGNSAALMPKLPYNVKLNTGVDLLSAMGLTCPYVTNTSGKPTCDKSKSYVLLANYDDKTMLRD